MTDEEKSLIKNKLIQWGQTDILVAEKQKEIEELKEKINSKKFDIMIPEYKRRIVLLEKGIKTLLRESMDIYDFLLTTGGRERDIIYYRYKDGISWDFIPEKVRLSRMQCFRIHNKAIEKLWEFFRKCGRR